MSYGKIFPLGGSGGSTPSGIAGAIQFSNGSAFASDASNLFWDDTNNRLGVGTDAPTTDLQVSALNPTISTRVTSNGTGKFAFLGSLANEIGSIQLSSASGELRMFTNTTYFPTFYSSGAEAMRISTARNLGIGLNNPTARTHIQGSGSTSATTSLLVQNSSGTSLFSVRDDGVATFSSSVFGSSFVGTVRTAFINSEANAFTVMRTNNSTGNATFDQSVAIGTTNAPTSRLQVVGSGTTSATTSLLVQNSAGTELFKVMDDGNVQMSGQAFTGVSVLSNSSSLRFDSGGVTGVIRMQGNAVGIGNNTTGDASALLTLTTTTKGFLPPRMTTTQKNAIASPASGLVVYDSTTNKLCCYNGSTWNDLF